MRWAPAVALLAASACVGRLGAVPGDAGDDDAAAPCGSDRDCDDGLACNGEERCGAEVRCLPGAPPRCDDGVECTADRCEEGAGCVYEADDARCDDGDACDGAERCDAASGCVPGAPVACDDGVACTEDACDPASGACTATARHERCEAGALCRAPGGCAVVACASDGECDDGDVCNGAERCEAPACAAGEPLRCDDGVFCNGAERCDPAAGCAPGLAPRCDDGRACTEDRCDAALDRCVAEARDGDGDGHGDAACGGDDCDDADPAVRPGGEERCGDGVDGDCDREVDEGCGCAPATCASAGAACGAVPDGCGGTLDCGGCTPPASCGGAGVANACGCATGCTVVGAVSRLAPDGMDIARVSAGGHPALVWNAGRWILFWERREHTPLATWGECSFGALALMATEIDSSGRVGSTRTVTSLGPETTRWESAGCGRHRRGIHALSRGDGFLVAWHERAAPSGDTETVYALVDASLVTTRIVRFGSAPWATPRIAGDASKMATSWHINAPVYGSYFASIAADGTRGRAREVYTVASHQMDFDFAWNGTHFGLVFESDRERLRRCGCEWSGTGHPVEVMLTRLSPAGVPVGADIVLSDGIEEGMWGMTGADVTALPGGGFGVAWVGTAAGGSDVAVRLVGPDGSRGPLRWVTSDRGARAESTATLVAGPDGLAVAYGHGGISASAAPWDIRGIRLRRLDASGAPVGDAVDVVSDTGCEPTCLQAPWSFPNSGDLRMVAAAGAPGSMYLVWPSDGGHPGTSVLHGALVSFR